MLVAADAARGAQFGATAPKPGAGARAHRDSAARMPSLRPAGRAAWDRVSLAAASTRTLLPLRQQLCCCSLPGVDLLVARTLPLWLYYSERAMGSTTSTEHISPYFPLSAQYTNISVSTELQLYSAVPVVGSL